MAKREKPLILVVDDLESHLKAIGNTLLTSGYEVTLALTGKRAIEITKNAFPDLILLDIVMPEISGFDVIKELKKDPATAEIPVIFLTSQNESQYLIEAFKLGAVDYILKPAKNDETIARVNTHLELRRSKAIIQEQNIELKALVQEKTEFLELASKDLKIPINELRGYLNLISQFGLDRLPAEIKDYMEKFDKITKNMANVINDLLLINDIESGNVKNIYKSIDINLTITKMIKSFENIARTKRITMSLETTLPQNTQIIADQEILETALTRILANTLRFAKPTPGINSPWSLVSIRTKSALIGGAYYAQLEVEDQGVGFSKDELSNIFKKFNKTQVTNQNNEAITQETGYHVIKLLIEQMNGKISIDSKFNIGTTVRLFLPTVCV
jgi:DNA-binding response OmpR family regulator